MATGSTTSSSTISDISGYCIFGEACYGSNGDSNGAPEIEVGAYLQSPSSGRKVWDTNPNDGISAGPLSVTFTAEAAGGTNGVKWAVENANPSQVNYSAATYGNITRVRVRAGVQTTALVSWTNLAVKFYKAGRLTDAYPSSGTLSTGPTVDTRTATNPVTGEQILEVTPVQSTNTKVVITGSITLAANQGVTPDVNDLFAQVFIDTATCST